MNGGYVNGLDIDKDSPLTMAELRTLPPWTSLVIENLNGPADFFELVTLKQDDAERLKGAIQDGPYDLSYGDLNVRWRAYRNLAGLGRTGTDCINGSEGPLLSQEDAAFLSRLKKDLAACTDGGKPPLWTIRGTRRVLASFDRGDVSVVHDDLRRIEWPVDDMAQVRAFLTDSSLAVDARRMYGMEITAKPEPDGATYVVIHHAGGPDHTVSTVVRNADALDSLVQGIQRRGGYGTTFPYRVRSYRTHEQQYPDAVFLTRDDCAKWLRDNKCLYGRDPRVVPIEDVKDRRYARLLEILRRVDWTPAGS